LFTFFGIIEANILKKKINLGAFKKNRLPLFRLQLIFCPFFLQIIFSAGEKPKNSKKYRIKCLNKVNLFTNLLVYKYAKMPINTRKRLNNEFLASISRYLINHTFIQEMLFLRSRVKLNGLKRILKLNLKCG